MVRIHEHNPQATVGVGAALHHCERGDATGGIGTTISTWLKGTRATPTRERTISVIVFIV